MADKKNAEREKRDLETSMPEAESLETFNNEPETTVETLSEPERVISDVAELPEDEQVEDVIFEALATEGAETADLSSVEEPVSQPETEEESPAAENISVVEAGFTPSLDAEPIQDAPEVESAPVAAEEETAPVANDETIPAESAEAPAETAVASEEADAVIDEALLATDDVVPVAVPIENAEQSTSDSAETPAQTEDASDADFVMDDEYMKAFMEEGAMDDFIYGGNFEERQELLDKIQDNAELLAEEGTELLEKKEQEAEKEVRYNEKGEPLDENGKAIIKRSLENKIIIADTRERRYYNKLKNALLAYEGVKAEMQTATEVFRVNKQVVARVSIAGFTRIYFALDPDEFDVDRYKQADRTEIEFEDTRMLIRVRNDDEFAIAVELLALMMGALGVNKAESYEDVDFLQEFPRREDAVLEKKGKYLSLEEKDTQALIKEKRAEERKAAGISEEPEPTVEEVTPEEKEEPVVILPLTLENKLHQSTNTIKLIYSKLKNELLSYKTVKCESTQKNDNFKAGKKIIARMTVVGEAVRLYLALDPKAYSTKKFKHKDASDQQGFEGTRLMKKAEGETERLEAVKLITEWAKEYKLERNSRYVYVPFAEKYPYIKNGVFKGDEDKPRVKHTGDEYADIYGELTEHLRSQLGATDAWGVPKGYTAEDGLTAKDLLELQRSKAKTMNAGVALATPIVHFYDAAIDEEGKIQYLNVQQILNDKFLGKMLPQEYFAMAEGSSRIEELNYITLELVTKDCNENPDIRFAVKISCRLLLKQETLTKLVDKMQTTNHNLILAFDCAMLEALGFAGVSAINTLKSQGALIMIDNAESASMRVLTEYEFDYLRLDARFYNGDSLKRLAHLDMITGYAAVQNIVTTSINCEHKEDARILLDHGVKVIQGDAVARPMRLISLALTNIKPVPKPKEKKNGEK